MSNKFLMYPLAAIFIGCSLWYAWSEGLLTPLLNLNSPEQTPALPLKEGWKMYENTEFGFSFQYPQGWTVTEERETNPYNKFKVAVTPQVYQYFEPFYVIYAAKEHTDRLTNNSRALGREILDITVGGRPAIRYEYDGEVHYRTIIIPFSEERGFIIGNARNENVHEYEQILASFRFIK